MSKIANDIMKDVCQLSLQNEFKRLTKLKMNSIIIQSLTTNQIDQLATKIGLLPSEYRNILFLRYCFSTPPTEIEKILDTESVIGKLRYIQKILSGFMGFSSSWVDENSIREACEIALIEDTKEYNNIEVLHKPKYSSAFRRKLKNIKIKQNPNDIFMLIVKRVAVFILVCILSLSTILAVNVEAREKIFNWIIDIFPRFSIFTTQNMDEDNIIKLTSIKINYVPKGFELVNTHEGHKILIYNYLAEDNQKLTIKLFALSDENKSYYDTERTKVEEIIFKGSQAYTWQTDEMTYLIWYRDGVEYYITGNLDKDDILKVAENISK